jgi:hypothetical protein
VPVDISTDILWKTSGHATSTTSVVVTHPDAGGTTAGSTVLVWVRSSGASNMTPPAGWVRDNTYGLGGIFSFRLDDAAAAETSWTFTRAPSAGNSAWSMMEVDHLSVDSFEVASAGTQGTNATGTTRSTGTSVLNAGESGLLVAVFGSTKAASGDTHSWASYTNSFTEQEDFNPAGVAGQCIAVAAKNFSGQSTFETTATFTTSTGTPATAAVLLVYRSYDAAITAPLSYLTGFEFGTHAGMGHTGNAPWSEFPSSLGNVPAAPGGTWGTHYSVTAGAAKDGDWGLEVANSATAHHVVLPTFTGGRFAFSGHVKPVSGSGTPTALWFDSANADLQLVYDVTTEKFGLQWEGGSPEWQTGTTPLDNYPAVQIRGRVNSSVYHAEWWIETGTGDGYQTSPADLTGMTLTSSITPRLGAYAGTNQTAVFHYDNPVISPYYAAFPLGVHTVVPLVPETTGATVSGTSSNFQRFTNNGTLANVSGTEGALLDDRPPTISASSDGVVQVAVAASDYLNLPMTTYTLAATEIVAGVRFLASLWGGTGSGTGTLGWRGHDGVTETTFIAASASYDADSLTTASATYPLWYTSMWSGGVNGAWDQTKLNAAAVRMGFSTDATPDMGASAVYLEVAVTTARTFVKYRLIDGEDPLDYQAAVLEYINPYNSGVRAYDIDNQDATRSVRFTYTPSGGSETEVIVGPSTLTPVTVNENAYGNVEATSFAWVV